MAAERVTSVSDGQYLVITGEAPPQESSNTQYVATGEKEYSLIPQEDYWNSCRNIFDNMENYQSCYASMD